MTMVSLVSIASSNPSKFIAPEPEPKPEAEPEPEPDPDIMS